MKYFGMTHFVSTEDEEQLKQWKNDNCSRNWHLFDEVHNSEDEHYLHCDACGLIVHIEKIETRYQEF